jgi:hypothetical protein
MKSASQLTIRSRSISAPRSAGFRARKQSLSRGQEDARGYRPFVKKVRIDSIRGVTQEFSEDVVKGAAGSTPWITEPNAADLCCNAMIRL